MLSSSASEMRTYVSDRLITNQGENLMQVTSDLRFVFAGHQVLLRSGTISGIALRAERLHWFSTRNASRGNLRGSAFLEVNLFR
ncbi:MAG: hypothetical protein ABL921_34340, partial [Pirellula sp.]